jgi:Ca-activated chloride channel family protein
MRGFGFSRFKPNQIPKGGFDELLKLFLELLNYTSGDAGEALAWLNELDKQYNLTNDDYGIGDFIDELKQKGYLKRGQSKRRVLNHSKNRAKHQAIGIGRNFRQA